MIQVITIGCRLNQSEGEQLKRLPLTVYREHLPQMSTDEYEGKKKKISVYISGLFLESGKREAGSDNHICIVNTCAVTREAVSTSWKMIRRQIKNLKSEMLNSVQHLDSKLIVTGCLATLEREKMLAMSGIDAVLTQEEKVSLLEKKPLMDTDKKERELNSICASSVAYLPSRSRPVIKIQDGCANECSFCVARVIRGRPKSVVPQIIIDEINRLTDLGYQEVVFTGLNLGCYGKDIGYSLTQLIQSLPTNTYRVRLSSLEPDTITDELLDPALYVQGRGRLCRHLHIPLQSGDNRTLKLMQRKYTRDSYRQLIEKIISKIPGINIGTDVIVGFPQEDESAFRNTLNLIEELPFGYLHVFPYSSRPGTESAKLQDTVNIEKKKERVRILRQIADKKKRLFRERFKQSVLEVLVEESRKQNAEKRRYNGIDSDKICENLRPMLHQNGLTDNYIRVTIPQHGTYHKGQLYKLVV